MSDKDTRKDNPDLPREEEEFGWDFHKGPLLAAVILTGIFYAVVFYLASI